MDAVTKVFPEIEELWLIARREDRLKAVASKRPDKRCVVIPMDPSDMNGYEAFTIIQLFWRRRRKHCNAGAEMIIWNFRVKTPAVLKGLAGALLLLN